MRQVKKDCEEHIKRITELEELLSAQVSDKEKMIKVLKDQVQEYHVKLDSIKSSSSTPK
uniref:Uncharacterized protein n=1 Tax=Amphimedon queenslandica TaxID=400682 RepID=A0A1X7SSH3_AMPQE